VSLAGKTRRTEAVLHAALVDGGFYVNQRTPARDEYLHRSAPVQAVLDRTGFPRLPVAVTLLDEATGRSVGMAAKPDRLRILLDRVL